MTDMFRRLFPLIAAVLVAPAALAQVHTGFPFLPGYVVTVAGDTLRGELAELPELAATKEVQFRSSPASPVTTFAPWQVTEVAFDNGRTYVRRAVHPADELPPEDLLLLRVVAADIALYAFSYEDPRSLLEHVRLQEGGFLAYRPQRFAIEMPDGSVHPLYERRVTLSEFDASQVRVDRQYVRRLEELFEPCPVEQRRVARVRFTQRALSDAVRRYNACMGSDVFVTEREASRRRTDVPVRIGARMSGGGGSMSNARRAHESGRTSAYWFGVQALVRPLLIHPRLTIPVEARVGTTSVNNDEISSPFEAADFDRIRAGLTAGLQYGIPVGTIEPFIGAGLGVSHVFGEQLTSCTILRCNSTPAAEGSFYFEIGTSIPSIQQISVGARYESTGHGHGNPFARKRSNWESRVINAFVIARL